VYQTAALLTYPQVNRASSFLGVWANRLEAAVDIGCAALLGHRITSTAGCTFAKEVTNVSFCWPRFGQSCTRHLTCLCLALQAQRHRTPPSLLLLLAAPTLL
jgi:hypothetical protein